MPFFRLLVGLRGCYADSSENSIYECPDAAALYSIINERAEFYSDMGEEASDLERCTYEEAVKIFEAYTGPRPPYLPTCGACWSNGQWGVLISGATAEEYEEESES